MEWEKEMEKRTEKEAERKTERKAEKRTEKKAGKKSGLAEKIIKGKKPGKDQFVICILAGILLLVIAMPVSKSSGGKASESGLTETVSGIMEEKGGAQDDISYENDEKIENAEEYERYMENKLEQAMMSMEGAGKVKVIVTVNTSKETVVEKDLPVKRNHVLENDSEGGSRSSNELEETEETVFYKRSDGTSAPYVVKTLQPVVEGVVVVAQGAERPEVSKNITEAIVALFDIEPHKIKVVKMKSE